jgi:UDP-N-acetylmuramate dehydrogenase
MSLLELPRLAGVADRNGSLADFIWFRTGGPAEWLIRPKDVADLSAFMRDLDPVVPVMPVGVGSNLIVRDGGVPGVVVRLPKSLAQVTIEPGNRVRAGAGAMGITVASKARDAGIAGLEFLRGIPGTAGGAVRMNAGAYGREVADILVEATLVLRDGTVETWPAARFGFTYRHSGHARRRGRGPGRVPGHDWRPGGDRAEMDRIAEEREGQPAAAQPHGRLDLQEPAGAKAWQLIDAAGCRGLQIGDAQVSEKHCNFLLNLGNARASDIEALARTSAARPGAFGCRAGMGNPARGVNKSG